MSYYIYCLKDPSGVVQYVGQTINPTIRKGDHRRHKPPHTFHILQVIEERLDARDTEIELIEKYDTYNSGWNKSSGGEGFEDYTREGIGGVKKGHIPWNKGKPGCFSEETRKGMSNKRKGVRHSSKLNVDTVREIRELYDSKPHIDGVGDVQKNGVPMSYVQAFSRKYHSQYGLTIQGLKRVVLKETWADV